MNTLKLLAVAVVSATLATAVYAKGPAGNGTGNAYSRQGRNATQSAGRAPAAAATAGAAHGTQARSQTRDPAANTTGTPIQSRDRIHTPGTGLATPTPPAN